MNELELRALVERMVADLMGQAPTPQVKAADYKPLERGQESGSGGEMLPDITEVDLRRQYLMPNPQNGPAFPTKPIFSSHCWKGLMAVRPNISRRAAVS